MTLAERMVVARAQMVGRRAARERRRQLVRELASYGTQAQQDDLSATFDRYPDGVTHELREILGSRPVPQAFPAMGRR